MALFNWFKRKNAQAVEDKEKGELKLNAADVFVCVNGKNVSVAELENAMIEEENEAEEKKANELEPLSMDETFKASNGKEYKVGDMVAAYNKKKNAEEEAAKANAISRGDAENLFEEYAKEKGGSDGEAFFDNPNLLTPQAISSWLKSKGKEQGDVNAIIGIWKDLLMNKKNAGKTPEELEAEKKAAEEAEKKNIEKAELEKKENAKKNGAQFFDKIHNAGASFEDDAKPTRALTRAERAAEWKARNSK